MFHVIMIPCYEENSGKVGEIKGKYHWVWRGEERGKEEELRPVLRQIHWKRRGEDCSKKYLRRLGNQLNMENERDDYYFLNLWSWAEHDVAMWDLRLIVRQLQFEDGAGEMKEKVTINLALEVFYVIFWRSDIYFEMPYRHLKMWAGAQVAVLAGAMQRDVLPNSSKRECYGPSVCKEG